MKKPSYINKNRVYLNRLRKFDKKLAPYISASNLAKKAVNGGLFRAATSRNRKADHKSGCGGGGIQQHVG